MKRFRNITFRSSNFAKISVRFMSISLRERYMNLVTKGEIKEDPTQTQMIDTFDDLKKIIETTPEILEYIPPSETPVKERKMEPKLNGEPKKNGNGGGFFSFFSSGSTDTETEEEETIEIEVPPEPENKVNVKGLYLYGTPGCGKTFMMDLFYESLDIKTKKRTHFNNFMLDVHMRVHQLAQEQKGKSYKMSQDPVPIVARRMAQQTKVLCFDEFQVTDIADAMMVQRLFSTLFENNVVVIATSNRPPDDLYYHGLQRHVFLPFIDLLKERTHVLNFESEMDYRYGGHRDLDAFIHPLDEKATDGLHAVFNKLAGGQGTRKSVPVMQGRKLKVPRQANGVAYFRFHELCKEALGAADYIALSENFHTVVISDIPIMSMESLNPMRRFILLVDG
eukprot:CAMPEP_0115002976 /NCGR_PEP_ID=MMETSP0216-20121206/18321_1 /TAXON_ID=223996 /ORGANISM="Protocruzia adherens, Strain Boccale" /LENGTH=392 /DNA_ID=CAMNT_0002368663 /DNA_START=32 /DNA_END=1206 /DNA_ORIENTATION=-